MKRELKAGDIHLQNASPGCCRVNPYEEGTERAQKCSIQSSQNQVAE